MDKPRPLNKNARQLWLAHVKKPRQEEPKHRDKCWKIFYPFWHVMRSFNCIIASFNKKTITPEIIPTPKINKVP